MPGSGTNVDAEDVPSKGKGTMDDEEEAKPDFGTLHPVCPEEKALPGTGATASFEEDAGV